LEVRDPIHGAIGLTDGEAAVTRNRWVQRLRNIRQVGFSHIPFPGATHTRYAHSIGVMHLAGEAFDAAYRGWTFDRPDTRERLRAALRLAALCHDLGHPPMSHCTEFSMPPLEDLAVGWYRHLPPRIATHEDYTIAILEQTSMAQTIAEHALCSARHVAALVSPDVRVGDDFFSDDGLDHRRLLAQIVSSELDVDRLDYLVRDATFTGAAYGRVDVTWLVRNLTTAVADGQVWLALRPRAVYAFDHFLLARHHMFLQVYFHHESVAYEEMMRCFVASPGSSWRIDADLGRYLDLDDVALFQHLRQSTDVWAQRIVRREPIRRAVERHGTARVAALEREAAVLKDAGILAFHASSTGRLSRYAVAGSKRRRAPSIFVVDQNGRADGTTLAESSQALNGFPEARCIGRLYVRPEDVERSRALLGT
jgi:uncharacterized protein